MQLPDRFLAFAHVLLLAALLLATAGCGMSEEDARQELADLNIEYTEEAFAEHAGRGDERAVELFMYTSLDPSEAITAAAEKNKKEILQALLQTGAVPDAEALLAPVAEENIEVVEMLLEAGAEPPSRALSASTSQGNIEITKALLEAGGEPSSRMLVDPVSEGNLEMVKVLLEAGVEPQGSVLSRPASRGNLEMVSLLLKAGAPPAGLGSAAGSGHLEIVRLLLEAGAEASADLMKAPAREGYAGVIRTLLDAGVDPNTPVSEGGSTALHWAAYYNNPEIIRALVEAGSDLDAIGDNRETPLQKAADRGQIEAVRALVEAGAEVSVAALYDATYEKHAEVVRFLVEAGADWNHETDGGTALRRAVYHCDAETVKAIVESGSVDVNKIQNDFSDRILEREIGKRFPCESIVRVAIENGADLSRENQYGNTPLAEALRNQKVHGENDQRIRRSIGEVIQVLRQAGAPE